MLTSHLSRSFFLSHIGSLLSQLIYLTDTDTLSTKP